jgi:hypothetical protein
LCNKKEKTKIKTGQIWKNKKKNYTIVVGKRLKDSWWSVCPHGKRNTVHMMQESSFHFYELQETV